MAILGPADGDEEEAPAAEVEGEVVVAGVAVVVADVEGGGVAGEGGEDCRGTVEEGVDLTGAAADAAGAAVDAAGAAVEAAGPEVEAAGPVVEAAKPAVEDAGALLLVGEDTQPVDWRWPVGGGGRVWGPGALPDPAEDAVLVAMGAEELVVVVVAAVVAVVVRVVEGGVVEPAEVEPLRL